MPGTGALPPCRDRRLPRRLPRVGCPPGAALRSPKQTPQRSTPATADEHRQETVETRAAASEPVSEALVAAKTKISFLEAESLKGLPVNKSLSAKTIDPFLVRAPPGRRDGLGFDSESSGACPPGCCVEDPHVARQARSTICRGAAGLWVKRSVLSQERMHRCHTNALIFTSGEMPTSGYVSYMSYVHTCVGVVGKC